MTDVEFCNDTAEKGLSDCFAIWRLIFENGYEGNGGLLDRGD